MHNSGSLAKGRKTHTDGVMRPEEPNQDVRKPNAIFRMNGDSFSSRSTRTYRASEKLKSFIAFYSNSQKTQ